MMFDHTGRLLREAEILLRKDKPLPTDLVSRLLAVGIDASTLEKRNYAHD